LTKDIQSWKNAKSKIFLLVNTYRKKLESFGVENERALNEIRNSGVVAKVELRKTMKKTRSQPMELYDKVGIF